MAYVISASILASDFTRLGEQVKEADRSGADWIHVDVMDGHFVPDITLGPLITQACREVTSRPLDVHLMIEKPERHLASFAEAGANIITVHIETCPHLYRTLQNIKELGCQAGVTLNPGTPANALDAVLPIADLVLVMTVNPGFGGQEFLNPVVSKIREIRRKLDALGSEAWLEVDGGIDEDTIPVVYEAGARAFVAGTAIFRNPGGIEAGIGSLRKAVPN